VSSRADFDGLLPAISEAVRIECDRIVEEEAKAAAARVETRLKELAPQLAMRLFTAFDITQNRQEIVIRVRQDEPR